MKTNKRYKSSRVSGLNPSSTMKFKKHNIPNTSICVQGMRNYFSGDTLINSDPQCKKNADKFNVENPKSRIKETQVNLAILSVEQTKYKYFSSPYESFTLLPGNSIVQNFNPRIVMYTNERFQYINPLNNTPLTIHNLTFSYLIAPKTNGDIFQRVKSEESFPEYENKNNSHITNITNISNTLSNLPTEWTYELVISKVTNIEINSTNKLKENQSLNFYISNLRSSS